LESELLHLKFAAGLGLTEKMRDISLSGGIPAEVDSMEIDKIEDVTQVDMIEFHKQRVARSGIGHAVDTDALASRSDEEVVYIQMVFAVNDIRGVDGERAVAYAYRRRADRHLCLCMTVGIASKLDNGV